MGARDHTSLHAMLQKDMQNEVPEAVLQHCPEADRVMVENLLRLAQTELVVLNLASTSIVTETNKIVLRCALTGPTPSVSLSTMRALQAYSPARVTEVRTSLHEGTMLLVIDVCDSSVRMGTTELEIVRITKRQRTWC